MRMKPKIRREHVEKWHENLVENANIHTSENVRKYVRESMCDKVCMRKNCV